MTLFKNTSIKYKVIGIILLVMTIILFISILVNAYIQINNTKDNIIKNASIETKLIADYLVTPLDFRFPDRAKEIIEKLKINPSISNVIVYDAELNLFAEQHANTVHYPKNQLTSSSRFFEGDFLSTWEPITFGGNIYGYIYIRYNTNLSSFVQKFWAISLLATFGLLVLSFFLAYHLQRLISFPINHLTHFMNTISDEENLNLRITKYSNDEIGKLYDGFNSLLNTIQAKEKERDYALKSLQESTLKYKHLVDSVSDYIWEVDREWKYTYISSKVTEILGYTPDEMLGSEIFSFQVDDSKEEYIRMLEEKKANKESLIGVVSEKISKKGEVIYITTNGTPILNKEGELTGYWGVSKDISETVLADTIKKKQESAEMANQAKSIFIANMSHEIRNPMNAVLGMANTLAKTTLSPDQQKYVDSLQLASSNLLGIINDILDFSKIESGKMQIDHLPFDLSRLLLETEQIYTTLATQKRISFTIHHLPNLPSLIGDKEKTRQIIANLVSNAIKFTDVGNVTLFVDSIPSTSNDTITIQLVVKDTGIGIPQEEITSIFNPFTQVDSTTTKKYGGTGLGLSIVSSFIALMNGSITVESTLHHGTTVKVIIPFSINHMIMPLPQQTPIEQTTFDHIHILIAEDEMINQLYLKTLLTGLGCGVKCVKNGRLALNEYLSEHYDLILMDGQMPEMDGFMATAKIREIEKTENKPHIPIIAITGYAIEGDKDKFTEAGIDDYITKPINEDELIHTIRRNLK